ncbi:related to transcription initiation factor IID beta chain [Rhynchosporium agropyri]|uniref:Related to transcription initiation factor IID beta chain n=1 Tax=Rhynchosporium agropyri TaxID=914238 RepID=A0A1E1L602_9HELO|nr:related to transcription initiation factor IID beta chain [Rhynchosporium agropyri]
MASPPYNHSYSSAISPPYPSNSQLPAPTKRRQSDMPSSAPSVKRRKASMLSTTSTTSSSHPLRQTSFPPEHNGRTPAFSRSPSMDTMSLASGSVAKKKKPRKSKGKDMDASSTRAKSVVSNGGKGKRRGSRDQSAEEEDEEDAGDLMEMDMAAASHEDKVKEDRRRHILTQSFSPDQFARYEAWRSSKLSDAVVRRIVNQTLSQSVPPGVILAVKSATKIFAGEIIERARKVQSQWIEATGDSQTGLPSPTADGDTAKEKETRRGPLLPDHLREAFRRHMLEGDGGLVGQLGLWQHQQHSGVERFGVKVQGKRLLK